MVRQTCALIGCDRPVISLALPFAVGHAMHGLTWKKMRANTKLLRVCGHHRTVHNLHASPLPPPSLPSSSGAQLSRLVCSRPPSRPLFSRPLSRPADLLRKPRQLGVLQQSYTPPLNAEAISTAGIPQLEPARIRRGTPIGVDRRGRVFTGVLDCVEVVLKFPLPNRAKFDGVLDLTMEAAVTWFLQRVPAVVRMFGICFMDGAVVLVLERWPADARILAETSVPTTRLCLMFQSLLSGLEHLQTLGLYHGDIKPMNILVDVQRCTAVFNDVGFSHTGGTAGFRSPGRAGRGSHSDDLHAFKLCVLSTQLRDDLNFKMNLERATSVEAIHNLFLLRQTSNLV